MAHTVSINFEEPIALIPLPGVALLPHTALPLHIAKPRYRQLLACVLAPVRQGKQPLPIGVASIRPEPGGAAGAAAAADARNPPLRQVVCVGHVVQHRENADGSYDIVLQGLCRAAIESIEEPDGGRMYRQAILRPIEGRQRRIAGLGRVRSEMRSLLSGLRLQRLDAARTLLEWIERPDLPNEVALELVALVMVRDEAMRYRLLAEADAIERAKLVWGEMCRTDRFIAKAQAQAEAHARRSPSRGVRLN